MRADPSNGQTGETRQTYDQKLEFVLQRAAEVFAERGFHRASIRDLARATGMSLAGHYYYFRSKNEALFRICEHVLRLILESFEERVKAIDDPLERLRLLVLTHLEISLSHMREMKVLSHEAESLRGEYLARIRQTKKRYYDSLVSILREIRGDRRGNGRELRLAAMTLFGSMNWIYTWYRPEVDGDAKRLTDVMLGIFLRGFLGGDGAAARRAGRTPRHPSR
ncbi:MAG: TetR/AcrR family transcriptional regulator [candidate division NC10 bacterium]|nr:TetR/AcrR family transcriptional regulator [candidate division NC10 bacterium]